MIWRLAANCLPLATDRNQSLANSTLDGSHSILIIQRMHNTKKKLRTGPIKFKTTAYDDNNVAWVVPLLLFPTPEEYNMVCRNVSSACLMATSLCLSKSWNIWKYICDGTKYWKKILVDFSKTMLINHRVQRLKY